MIVMFMTGFFSYKPLAIMSDSMKPVYARGSIAIIQKANAMDVSVGDIVQYTMPGHMITHRVVRIDTTDDATGEKIFITKADSSRSEDRPVQANQIDGTVRATVPYIRYPNV